MSEQVKVAALPACDIDNDHGDAAVDGKTTMGPWAFMCEDCFRSLGVGLGTSLGQRLVLAGKEDK